MDFREVGYDDRDWINLAQDRDRCEGDNEPPSSLNAIYNFWPHIMIRGHAIISLRNVCNSAFQALQSQRWVTNKPLPEEIRNVERQPGSFRKHLGYSTTDQKSPAVRIESSDCTCSCGRAYLLADASTWTTARRVRSRDAHVILIFAIHYTRISSRTQLSRSCNGSEQTTCCTQRTSRSSAAGRDAPHSVIIAHSLGRSSTTEPLVIQGPS
ncbi:hypothetical protein ANN_16054 [Periplaneta americana]|uniref:Uncharacterized protein n=1 Tax=Periplaneta americana TaxID=6978 RepID=A0ABQ8SI63_PERAM|nr:hypothetical protein ANN_16054 [Periplaneta americana]